MAKRKEISRENYLKGLNEVIENIQAAVDDIERGSIQGLKDALLMVAEKSQEKAPVDTGDLRGSVYVEIDNKRIAEGDQSGDHIITLTDELPENGTVGIVGFGSVYAANQHEHVEYDHPKGGEAKYLEKVLISEQNRILNLIAGGIELN